MEIDSCSTFSAMSLTWLRYLDKQLRVYNFTYNDILFLVRHFVALIEYSVSEKHAKRYDHYRNSDRIEIYMVGKTVLRHDFSCCGFIVPEWGESEPLLSHLPPRAYICFVFRYEKNRFRADARQIMLFDLPALFGKVLFRTKLSVITCDNMFCIVGL